MKKIRLRIEHLFMLIFAFFAALGHPLGRIIVREMHPIQLGTVTLLIGLVVLILYIMFTGRLKSLFRIDKKDILLSAGIGVFGFFFFQILTFSALARIPASVNAFLINTSVVYISLLAAVFLKERIPLIRILAIALALMGVVLVVFNRGFRLERAAPLLGCLFSILGAIAFAIYSVFGKKLLQRNDPINVVAIAVFSGAVLLSIFTRFSIGYSSIVDIGGKTWLLTILLGATMIGLAYPMWFLSLRRLPASHVSVYLYMTPLFAVLLSFLILHETFGWLFWIGGLLILGGIVLSGLSGK
ncbi:MAG: DMT family transporter, partial [Spirochaetes bacterium]|nr:DMT family transporter [Spirochaetota bacterium]